MAVDCQDRSVYSYMRSNRYTSREEEREEIERILSIIGEGGSSGEDRDLL
jgi:hypothetical protein